MQWLFILVICVECILGYPKPLQNSKIVSGVDVGIEEVPWMVSLRQSGTHYCGGSILSASIILTAAQCVQGIDESTITVVSGTSSLSEGGNIHTIDEIVIHEMYNPDDSWRNDIALLKLSEPITMGDVEQPVPLPEQGESPGDSDSYGYLTGWGFTAFPDSAMSDKLQKLIEKLVSNDECNGVHHINVYLSNMCAGIIGGEGFCTGDTGGPLVAGGKQVGIVSWSRDCAYVTDVYTRVAKFIDWISEHAT